MGKDGKPGKSGKSEASGSGSAPKDRSDTRTPLEKSRGIGHKDGGAVRNAIDHVKAYKDGTVDGYFEEDLVCREADLPAHTEPVLARFDLAPPDAAVGCRQLCP